MTTYEWINTVLQMVSILVTGVLTYLLVRNDNERRLTARQQERIESVRNQLLMGSQIPPDRFKKFLMPITWENLNDPGVIDIAFNSIIANRVEYFIAPNHFRLITAECLNACYEAQAEGKQPL